MKKTGKHVTTTMEEDFRAIGLLRPLSETDDPTKPRDIPSPAPETEHDLDDSEGVSAAKQPAAKQPSPKKGPAPSDSAAMDPTTDGGSAGAHKGGSGGGSTVAGSKEASIRGEAMEMKPTSKQPMKGGKDRGQKPAVARGLAPVKKIAGMGEGRFGKAAAIIDNVHSILSGVQQDEDISELLRSYQLVAENASLLADRFADLYETHKVESIVAELEELAKDAVEAVGAIEDAVADMDGGADEDAAVRNSSKVESEAEPKSDRNADEVYDIPAPAFKVEAEELLGAMTSRLMESLEAYDGVIAEAFGEPEDDGDDRQEIHVHTKAKKVHIHHGDDDGDEGDMGDEDPDADPDADMGADQDPDADMAAQGDGDEDDMGGEADPDADMDADQDDGAADHETNSLMARMKALKARREAMGGGRPFRGQQ